MHHQHLLQQASSLHALVLLCLVAVLLFMCCVCVLPLPPCPCLLRALIPSVAVNSGILADTGGTVSIAAAIVHVLAPTDSPDAHHNRLLNSHAGQ